MRASLIIGLLASAATIFAEPSAPLAQTAPPTPSLDGIWEGKMNDLPAIALNVKNSGSKVSGTIAFYFQERSDPSGPWHATARNAAPLLLPHVEGNTLTFELQHRKCHDCAEFGPNQKFRIELRSENEARLWMWENGDSPKEPGPGLKLERKVEPTSPSKVSKSPLGF